METIEKNLNEYKYQKASDVIGEINCFLMTLFNLTNGSEAKDRMSELLIYSTQNIDTSNLA